MPRLFHKQKFISCPHYFESLFPQDNGWHPSLFGDFLFENLHFLKSLNEGLTAQYPLTLQEKQ